MIVELDILKLLSNRYKYKEYYFIVKDNILTKEATKLLESYNDYFLVSSEDDIDFNKFIAWFSLTYGHSLKEDKLNDYKTILSNLGTYIVAKKLADYYIDVLKNRKLGYLISNSINKYLESNDSKHLEDSYENLKRHFLKKDLVETVGITLSLPELLATTTKPGLEFRLNELNLALGSLSKGDLIVISARPDSGKTTFALSESAHMIKQLKNIEGGNIIWFNNEERGEKVRLRFIQSVLEKPIEEITINPEYYWNTYKEWTDDKFILIDKAVIKFSEVERILENKNPGLIVFDQLRKITGFGNKDSPVINLQDTFSWAREIAKQYAPVIAIHQARGDAEGQLYIGLNQLDFSQTAIQGEADAIITLGRSYEPGYEYIRGLYVAKNKMIVPGGSSSYRNFRGLIELNPEIAKFNTRVV